MKISIATGKKLRATAFFMNEIEPILEYLQKDNDTEALALANMIGAVLDDKTRQVRINN